MIIKHKQLILHEPVTSQVGKTGGTLYTLVVRDPLDDKVYNKVYSYDGKYKDMKVGTELTLDLQLIDGNLKTMEKVNA
jgi:hypothetical protein